MRALEVIVAKNREAAAREEQEAFEAGQYALAAEIANANAEADREEDLR